MAGLQGTTAGACGDDGGGGHIGGLLCSGIIEDLIAECRQHPAQALCGRLARRVIQKCQDQTTGLCPGSLKYISQNCFHGLQPVERANLTDIVLCVYKSLDPRESADNMSLWLSAVVFALVFLAALAILMKRFEEVKSFVGTNLNLVSSQMVSGRQSCQQNSQMTASVGSDNRNGQTHAMQSQSSDHVDGATGVQANGHLIGRQNGHAVGNGPVSVSSQSNGHLINQVNEHVVSEQASVQSQASPVKQEQNTHVPSGQPVYSGDRRIRTAILYPEFAEAAIEDVTNNFVKRFNERSTSGRLITCSFFQLADVPDDTLVLVPCLVPSRLGTNVRRVLRAHSVRKPPVESNRVLLVLHHNESVTSPASLKATSSITGASQSHLANAFKAIVDAVFYRGAIYDCAQNKRACDQLEEVIMNSF